MHERGTREPSCGGWPTTSKNAVSGRREALQPLVSLPTLHEERSTVCISKRLVRQAESRRAKEAPAAVHSTRFCKHVLVLAIAHAKPLSAADCTLAGGTGFCKENASFVRGPTVAGAEKDLHACWRNPLEESAGKWVYDGAALMHATGLATVGNGHMQTSCLQTAQVADTFWLDMGDEEMVRVLGRRNAKEHSRRLVMPHRRLYADLDGRVGGRRGTSKPNTMIPNQALGLGSRDDLAYLQMPGSP